ncbi:MAG: hypothetical protein U1F67_20415 [Rubrivivax sp.]
MACNHRSGLLQEMLRRHERHREAGEQGLQDAADQPHVVMVRQPRHAARMRAVLEGLLQRAQVGDEVAA